MGSDKQKRGGKVNIILGTIVLIAALAGSAKAVLYAVGQLLLGNKAASVISPLILVGVFWLALLLICIVRKAKWDRILAIIGMIAVPIVVLACIYVAIQVPGKNIIIVAGFDGPEPDEHRVTEILVGKIHKLTAENRDIEVRALRETISEQMGSDVARSKGKEVEGEGKLLLWGWYTKIEKDVLATINFEALQGASYIPLLRLILAEATAYVLRSSYTRSRPLI